MSSIVLGAFFVARAFSDQQEKLETLDGKSVKSFASACLQVPGASHKK